MRLPDAGRPEEFFLHPAVVRRNDTSARSINEWTGCFWVPSSWIYQRQISGIVQGSNHGTYMVHGTWYMVHGTLFC